MDGVLPGSDFRVGGIDPTMSVFGVAIRLTGEHQVSASASNKRRTGGYVGSLGSWQLLVGTRARRRSLCKFYVKLHMRVFRARNALCAIWFQCRLMISKLWLGVLNHGLADGLNPRCRVLLIAMIPKGPVTLNLSVVNHDFGADMPVVRGILASTAPIGGRP